MTVDQFLNTLERATQSYGLFAGFVIVVAFPTIIYLLLEIKGLKKDISKNRAERQQEFEELKQENILLKYQYQELKERFNQLLFAVLTKAEIKSKEVLSEIKDIIKQVERLNDITLENQKIKELIKKEQEKNNIDKDSV